jgi:hypothetical protein
MWIIKVMFLLMVLSGCSGRRYYCALDKSVIPDAEGRAYLDEVRCKL